MFDAKLIINGQEFPLHYKLLKSIADHLPSGENYAPLAKALLDLNIPSITQGLVDNECLTVEDRDAIWENGDLDIRRSLADENAFRINLSDAQASQIIAINDSEILKSIANWAEQLYPEEDEEQAMRLSGKMADALLEFMASHSDESVRRELAENSQAPAKFRPKFSEMLKNGLHLGDSAIAGMTMEDVEMLQNATLDNLKAVANSAENIKDRKVRARVLNFLGSHPDPAVRLELAENYAAPQSVMERLAKDEDPDIANEAGRHLLGD